MQAKIKTQIAIATTARRSFARDHCIWHLAPVLGSACGTCRYGISAIIHLELKTWF
jgi:hypothetical protein